MRRLLLIIILLFSSLLAEGKIFGAIYGAAESGNLKLNLATVELRRADNNKLVKSINISSGSFVFNRVPNGKYKLVVLKSNFMKKTVFVEIEGGFIFNQDEQYRDIFLTTVYAFKQKEKEIQRKKRIEAILDHPLVNIFTILTSLTLIGWLIKRKINNIAEERERNKEYLRQFAKAKETRRKNKLKKAKERKAKEKKIKKNPKANKSKTSIRQSKSQKIKYDNNINSYFEGYDRAVTKSKEWSSEEYYSTEREIMRPTSRLYMLISSLGFVSKESQKEIIEALLEHSNYVHYMYKGEQTIYDNPKKIIEGLVADYELRKNKKLKKQIKAKSTLAATDIADYVFCPSSFSIKQSFDVPKTFEMAMGEELHDKRHLDGFLSNLMNKRKRKQFQLSLRRQIEEGVDIKKRWSSSNKFEQLNINTGLYNFISNGNPIDLYRFYKNKKIDESEFNQNELKEILKGMYGDLLKSKCVFYGHKIKDTKPFFSKDRKFAGVPDYIFERKDGSKFIVEEKHTWKEEVFKPWESHKMQVQTYLNTVIHKNESMSDGYIIYFSWNYYNDKLKTQNPRLYKINKTAAYRTKLMEVHSEILDFMNSGDKEFDNSSIHTKKCFKCSSRIYCDNMNKNRNNVNFPYRY